MMETLPLVNALIIDHGLCLIWKWNTMYPNSKQLDITSQDNLRLLRERVKMADNESEIDATKIALDA